MARAHGPFCGTTRRLLLCVACAAGCATGHAAGVAETTTATLAGERDRPLVSAEDQDAEAQRLLDRAASLTARVSRMLDEARARRDIVQVTCLDEDLTQARTHHQTLAAHAGALRAAIARGDDAQRQHEIAVITGERRHLDFVDRRATECLGQSALFAGLGFVTGPRDAPR